MIKPKGKTALHSTILSGNIELVRDLLHNSMDVNQLDDSENAPLHIAAIKGYLEIAKLLIANGADIDVKNQHGSLPLHLAAQFNNTATALLLIKSGSDINVKDRYGDTALHFAVSNNNVILVQKLISEGVQLNSVNVSFLTPLSLAIKNSNRELIEILEEAGSVIPKSMVETAKYAFKSANIFRKSTSILFILFVVGLAIVATLLTSGKLILSIPVAIMASVGFIMICFDKPYRRVRNLEIKVLNEMITQEEADQLLFSRKVVIRNKKIDESEFFIKEALNDNIESPSSSNKKKNSKHKISS